jgi:hypothetical protein
MQAARPAIGRDRFQWSASITLNFTYELKETMEKIPTEVAGNKHWFFIVIIPILECTLLPRILQKYGAKFLDRMDRSYFQSVVGL